MVFIKNRKVSSCLCIDDLILLLRISNSFKNVSVELNYSKDGELKINFFKINVNIFSIDFLVFNWFVGMIFLICYLI